MHPKMPILTGDQTNGTHHFVTKSWKSEVNTPCGSLGGGCGKWRDGRKKQKKVILRSSAKWKKMYEKSPGIKLFTRQFL